jgi:hypothetical protein
MKKLIAFTLAFVLTPLLALAQTQIRNDEQLVAKAIKLGNTFISIIIALSVIWIIWGVFNYLIRGANSEDARKEGGKTILHGVIGLFVILSIWGLVAILKNSLVTDDRTPTEKFPTVNNIVTSPR